MPGPPQHQPHSQPHSAPHERGRLSAQARRALRGQEPPTARLGLRATRSRMDDVTAHATLELALRIGDALLGVGASAAEVTATVLRVAEAYGMTSCQADITYTSLTVSYDRDDAVPLTALRVVKSRGSDYTRLQGVNELVHRISQEGLDAETAHRQLDEILATPHPYRRWVGTLAIAGMAAGVAVLFGGGLVVALLAAVTSGTIEVLLRRLSRWGLPAFFQQAAAAALATGVALLLQVAGVQVSTSLVVAAGIVVLLAGLSLVGAAQDAINGFNVTAAARAFEVVTLTAGIVVGIGFVLDVGRRAELPLDPVDATAAGGALAVQVPAAAAIAACWAVAAFARLRAALLAAAAGVVAWTTYALATGAGAGDAPASAVAAAVVAVAGSAVSRRMRVPPLLVVVCGIVPLLPGLAIYRGMFALVVQGDTAGGAATLLGAGAVGLGLAAGVSLGEFLASVLHGDLLERRVRRRATGGDRR